jgi:hypothetical protein
MVTVDRPEIVTGTTPLSFKADGAAATGGEQAANTLQPGSSSRHTTTANAKVAGTTAASLLVEERPCLFSHGRGLVELSAGCCQQRSHM